jgi:hypothetical protein
MEVKRYAVIVPHHEKPKPQRFDTMAEVLAFVKTLEPPADEARPTALLCDVWADIGQPDHWTFSGPPEALVMELYGDRAIAGSGPGMRFICGDTQRIECAAQAHECGDQQNCPMCGPTKEREKAEPGVSFDGEILGVSGDRHTNLNCVLPESCREAYDFMMGTGAILVALYTSGQCALFVRNPRGGDVLMRPLERVSETNEGITALVMEYAKVYNDPDKAADEADTGLDEQELMGHGPE